MAQVGETIVNPSTGEEITWRRVDDDVLEWEDVWTQPGYRTAPHVHPGLEERWEVVEGTAAFLIGTNADDERTLGPGESISAPAGTEHVGWNPTDEPVRLKVTMTPAGRWAEVVELLFGWAREGKVNQVGMPTPDLLVKLLRDYPDEIAAPPPR